MKTDMHYNVKFLKSDFFFTSLPVSTTLSLLREETTIFFSVAFTLKDLGRDTKGRQKRKEKRGEEGQEKGAKKVGEAGGEGREEQ